MTWPSTYEQLIKPHYINFEKSFKCLNKENPPKSTWDSWETHVSNIINEYNSINAILTKYKQQFPLDENSGKLFEKLRNSILKAFNAVDIPKKHK